MMEDREKKAAAANLSTAQQNMMVSIQKLFDTVGSIMLQLRCHEKAVQLHDDITDRVRVEVTDTVIDTYFNLLGVMETVEPAVDLKEKNRNTVLRGIRRQMERVPYADAIDAVGSKYIQAFPKDRLAQMILRNLGDLIGERITEALPSFATVLVRSMEGQRVGIVECKAGEVSQTIRTATSQGFRENAHQAVLSMFVETCPDLLNLAVLETRQFNYLVKEGEKQKDAAEAALSRYRDDVCKIMDRIAKNRKPPEQEEVWKDPGCEGACN